MRTEDEDSLPAQLFSENEWRLLWWKTFLLQSADPGFPNDHRDVEWIAFAAEMSVRHWCLPVIKRIRPMVDAALEAEYISRVSPRVRELLTDFQHEMHNPILARDVQDGPWQAPDTSDDLSCGSPTDPPASFDHLFKMAAHAVSTRQWLDWRRYGDVHWAGGLVERHGRTRSRIPTMWDHVGFANFDLGRAGLPIIEVDDTGRLFVDLGKAAAVTSGGLPREELRQRVDRLAARHGFSSSD